jgi:hypothetical protein
MNWPEFLLHAVGREEVENRGKLEKEVIFESEHRRWSHQGGFRENTPGHLFTTSLREIAHVRQKK